MSQQKYLNMMDTEDSDMEVQQYCCRSCCGRRCNSKDVRFYLGDFVKFVLSFALTFAIIYVDMGSRIDNKVTSVNLELANMKLGTI
jgi:hypothetical protein